MLLLARSASAMAEKVGFPEVLVTLPRKKRIIIHKRDGIRRRLFSAPFPTRWRRKEAVADTLM
jgi:hypothetical protein